MTPEVARATLAQLEALYAPHLAGVPSELRDRWDGELAKMLAGLGVDLGDGPQAAAAFAGAYIATVTMYQGSAIPIGNMQIAILMLRDLADRTDATSMVAEIDKWLKTQ